ncbi:MAG: hypothetical protein ACLSDQ_13965 [Adlercreutzia equolifaciens]
MSAAIPRMEAKRAPPPGRAAAQTASLDAFAEALDYGPTNRAMWCSSPASARCIAPAYPRAARQHPAPVR